MHRLAVAVLCLSLSAMASATAEETIVRTAYAKLITFAYSTWPLETRLLESELRDPKG